MRGQSRFNVRLTSGTGLAGLLILVMLGTCAMPSTTPTATFSNPTATVMDASSPEPVMTQTPSVTTLAPIQTPAASAWYQLTFVATWSEVTHPIDFPANPHFSGLIGASHSDAVRLWVEGETATRGIKNMAETGGKSPLDSEIDALISSGSACAKVSGAGINPSPGVVTVRFEVSPDCPVVSVVSMIAPSPDWFVGVSGLSLYEDGQWLEQKVVELFPYDAGTDSGGSYSSRNEPMDTPDVIRRIEAEPLLIDGSVPPLGTFTFSRLDD